MDFVVSIASPCHCYMSENVQTKDCARLSLGLKNRKCATPMYCNEFNKVYLSYVTVVLFESHSVYIYFLSRRPYDGSRKKRILTWEIMVIHQ